MTEDGSTCARRPRYVRLMRRLVLALSSAALLACGPTSQTPDDAGPDTSCGLDCAAQSRYGLVVDRCFEYVDPTGTSTGLPALGAWVRPVVTLEGGLKVLPVEYRVNGQIKMVDNFTIRDGALLLARREFTTSGRSVTYRTGTDITGVQWLLMESGPGETYTTTTDAYLTTQTGGETVATSYRMSTAEASTSELKTPLETYASGLKLLAGETPDHGSDPRRVFVPEVGFTLIASPLSLEPGAAVPLSLTAIREPGTADGGTEPCSLGPTP